MILDEVDEKGQLARSEGSTMSMSPFPPRAPLVGSYGQSPYTSHNYALSTPSVNEPLLPYAFTSHPPSTFEQYPGGGSGMSARTVMGMVSGGARTGGKLKVLAILAGGSIIFLLHAHFFRPRGPLHPDRHFWGGHSPPFPPPPPHRPAAFEMEEERPPPPPPPPPPVVEETTTAPAEQWEELHESKYGSKETKEAAEIEKESLPILHIEQFIQARRQLPPTWPDPWENSKAPAAQVTLLRESLSTGRFGGEGDGGVGERGRSDPPMSALISPPVKYLEKAMEWARYLVSSIDLVAARTLKASGLVLNPLDGRPVPIPHSQIYMGGKTAKAPTIDISDIVKGNGVKELEPIQWAGDRRERDGVSYIGRGESGKEREERRRSEWVKRAFLHTWEGYKKNAWGHDELAPTSDGFTDPFNGWGATIVDSLDTLLIMNLQDEYNIARNHVSQIDFMYLVPRGKKTFSTKLPRLTDMDIPKTEEELEEEETARKDALADELAGYEKDDLEYTAKKLFDDEVTGALDDGPQGGVREAPRLARRQANKQPGAMKPGPMKPGSNKPAPIKSSGKLLRIDPDRDQRSPKTIPLFETTIRYLGGLLSAYDLSGDPLMLQRARELGDILLPSMGTKFGLAIGHYVLGANPKGLPSGRSVLSEVGSLTLEFTKLSMLTGNDIYYRAVQRGMDTLETGFALAEDQHDKTSPRRRLGTLLPAYIDPGQPNSTPGDYTFGGLADSYYEYLIKQHQLLGGATPQYAEMYASAIDAAHEHLIRRVEVIPGREDLTIIGTVKWGRFASELEHLTCFAGAMLGLGAKILSREKDMDTALNVTEACVWAYESSATGVGPESIMLYEPDDVNRYSIVLTGDGRTKARKPRGTPIGVKTSNSQYLGRPETIESVYYMWRLTGDRKWQDQGWQMFTSWMETAITESGMAVVKNVHYLPTTLADSMESFVLAETFKYYYLLFSPRELISLDDWVFNTEAHPLRVAKPNPKKPDYEKFWSADSKKNAEKLMNPSGKASFRSTMGEGTPVQHWARVQQAAAQAKAKAESLLKSNKPASPPAQRPAIRPSAEEIEAAVAKERLAAALLAEKQAAAAKVVEAKEDDGDLDPGGGRPNLKDVLAEELGDVK